MRALFVSVIILLFSSVLFAKEEPFADLKAKADAGDADAMLSLGLLYSTNVLHEEGSQEQAFEWFKKSANAGNSDAMWNFGGVL